MGEIMIKTLKTIFAVAVSFSIVTISSAFADGHMGCNQEMV